MAMRLEAERGRSAAARRREASRSAAGGSANGDGSRFPPGPPIPGSCRVEEAAPDPATATDGAPLTDADPRSAVIWPAAPTRTAPRRRLRLAAATASATKASTASLASSGEPAASGSTTSTALASRVGTGVRGSRMARTSSASATIRSASTARCRGARGFPLRSPWSRKKRSPRRPAIHPSATRVRRASTSSHLWTGDQADATVGSAATVPAPSSSEAARSDSSASAALTAIASSAASETRW